SQIMRAVEADAGTNAASYPEPVTPARVGLVQPSPDFLYVACSYSLSINPVRVTAPVAEGYWSLGLYDGDTTNFFSLNGEQAGAEEVEIIVTGPASKVSGVPQSAVIEAPTFSGLVLIRFVVPNAEALDAVDRLRRQVRCEPFDRTGT
ncbi:MAG: DUF1254 domain-containing protein, partial [Pseudomonadota bacterium]